MQLKVRVMDDENRAYKDKNGKPGMTREVTLMDADYGDGVPMMKEFMVLLLDESDRELHKVGSLNGQIVTVAPREMKTGFGGKLQIRGTIIVKAKKAS